jgi:hypothetical protein
MPTSVCITNASCCISYNFLSALLSGYILGPDTDIKLVLYDQYVQLLSCVFFSTVRYTNNYNHASDNYEVTLASIDSRELHQNRKKSQVNLQALSIT